MAEQITEIINTFIIYIFYQMMMIPILIANFYAYFTMNSEDDGFQWFLNFPFWYGHEFQVLLLFNPLSTETFVF